MPLKDIIFNKLHALGYEHIKMNYWTGDPQLGGGRLYVNIKGQESFCYDFAKQCSIRSTNMLPRDFFYNVRTLCPFLQRHQDAVLRELREDTCGTDNTQNPIEQEA